MSPRKEAGEAGKSAAGESVSDNWNQLSEQIERLREDIAAINDSVSGLAKAGVTEGRERIGEQIDELAARVREMGGDIHSRGRKAARDAGRQAGDLSRELEASINRNPFMALLMALGLGFIIGLTTRSRG